MIIKDKKYNIFSSISICFKCNPIITAAMVVLYVLQGITPLLLTISTAKFIDSVLQLLQSTNYNYSNIYYPLIIIIVAISYDWISTQLINILKLRLEILLRYKVSPEIIEKIAGLNYGYIENPETNDLITKISESTEESILNSFMSIFSFFSLILRVFGIFIILFVYTWQSSLIIFAVSIPLVWISLKGGKASYDGISQSQMYKRRFEYISKILTSRDAAEEKSLFKYADFLNNYWHKQYEIWRKINTKVNIKHFTRAKLSSTSLAIIAIFIMMILIPAIDNGKISMGVYTSLVTNIFSLVQYMSWSLINNVTDLAKYNSFFYDMTKFVNLEGSIQTEKLEFVDEFTSLEFRNVSFAYPGTNKYILKDISFQLQKGKSHAFVGVNGCGKTTLTKLMIGLYDTNEGEILINGKDIKEYEQSQLNTYFSVVFQDFTKYGITFYDNIAIGNINEMSEKNSQDVYKAINTMDLEPVIKKLSYGAHTYLGKIKRESEDLSHGQWQRVAIARCLVNRGVIKILDEPTAALDPLAESALYTKFQQLSKTDTTIIISHRLGSAKQADIIFVIDNGSVASCGNHDYLIEHSSIYKQMYESQRSWYENVE